MQLFVPIRECHTFKRIPVPIPPCTRQWSGKILQVTDILRVGERVVFVCAVEELGPSLSMSTPWANETLLEPGQANPIWVGG